MSGRDLSVLLLTNPAHAAHAWPGHPERPSRIEAVAAGIADGAVAAGVELRQEVPSTASATPAAEALPAVHDPAYLEQLAAWSRSGGAWLDADTYVVGGSPEAAQDAAAVTAAGALAVARGEATVAFAAVRPPGHHAHAAFGRGFCLLNNVVVAAHALRFAGLVQRIAILDWDVHHGDGTQAMVGSDTDTFYASTHQAPFYPGSGGTDENSETVLNVPLVAGSGDPAFVAAWRETILPRVTDFAPEAILVSAGFDAHRDDPLAALEVSAAGFGAVATGVGALARSHGLPGVALTLEGGYDLDALRASAAATITGLLRGLGGADREGGT